MFSHALAYVMSVVVADRKSDRNEKGVTAVEYALIIGTMAAVVVAAMAILGPKVTTLFGKVG